MHKTSPELGRERVFVPGRWINLERGFSQLVELLCSVEADPLTGAFSFNNPGARPSASRIFPHLVIYHFSPRRNNGARAMLVLFFIFFQFHPAESFEYAKSAVEDFSLTNPAGD